MDPRQPFLDALAKNEDDTTSRLVYADWLEERGFHEEADRQRQWPAAKEWLQNLSQQHNNRVREEFQEYVEKYGEFFEYTIEEEIAEYGITYEQLLEIGNGGEEGYYVGGKESLQEILNDADTNREYWKNWSIVTGKPSPEDDDGYFRCAC